MPPATAPDAPRRLSEQTLAQHTTIGLGGPARSFARVYTATDLVNLVSAADTAGTPVLVLGGGSNLVVSDDGFDGLVVQVAHRGFTFERTGERVVLRVAAGEPFDDVVAASLAEGLAGLESLSGIPGLAGATPLQNVGAYGAEISDIVVGVRVFDRVDRKARTLSAPECGFGYRTSALKGNDRYLVLSLDLALRSSAESAPLRYTQLAAELGASVGASASTSAVRAAVLALRASKGMLIDAADSDSVSAGSFFTNPVLDAAELPPGAPRWPAVSGPTSTASGVLVSSDSVKTSAAWLIEQAGFRPGYRVGRVGLSSKHTLALINRGDASTAELLDFARMIRDGVKARFGITLEPEPALVGVTL